MTWAQLRTFLAVAETGSVRQAAERLVVSQPAVSSAMRTLQDAIGVPLVVREGRGLRLTDAGEVYARYARAVLGLLEEGAAAAAGRLHPERGRLRLGAVTTAAEHVLPPYLASFRERFPEAELELEVGNRTRVWGLLQDHQADLVIGGRPPLDGRFETVARRPHALAVVAAGGRERNATVTARELADEVWLLREVGSGTRASVEELLDEMGIAPRTLTLGSNGAVRASAAAGLGVTLMSLDAIAGELERGELTQWRVSVPLQERHWHAVARAGEEIPPTAALFLGHLREEDAGSPAFV